MRRLSFSGFFIFAKFIAVSTVSVPVFALEPSSVEGTAVPAERAVEIYRNLWDDFNGRQEQLLKAEVETDEQGHMVLSRDPDTGETVVSIRLEVNDGAYDAWKKDALKKMSSIAKRAILLSSEKNGSNLKLVCGAYFRFDDETARRIRNWENEEKPPDPQLAVRFEMRTPFGILSGVVSMSEFYRRGNDSFAFPLYEMNRLKDLPRNRFQWRGDEAAFATLAVRGLTLSNASVANTRCSIFRETTSQNAEPAGQKENNTESGVGRTGFRTNAYPDVVIPKWEFPFTREDVIRQLMDDMVQLPGKKTWIGKHEVTQIEWAAVMGIESFVPGYQKPRVWEGYWCPYDPAKTIEHPVSCMTFHECLDFIDALNSDPIVSESGFTFRLPGDDEWTAACLAGGRGMFGKLADGRSANESNLGNTEWIADNHPHPVGLKQENAFGLHDMHGNVREWTKEGHVRGGSWRSLDPKYCSVHLIGEPSGTAALDTGFRLAATSSASANKAKTGGFSGQARLPAAKKSSESRRVVRSEAGQHPVPYREPARRWIDKTIHLGPNVDLVVRRTPDGIWFGKYPITQGQWNAVMGKNYNQGPGLNSPYPVECISWDDCFRFLERLNGMTSVRTAGIVFRLPTQEEWKRACRAGAPPESDFAILPDGTPGTFDEMGWNTFNCPQDIPAGPQPVGRKKPNDWGLYDMYGNVCEWTSTTSVVHDVKTQFPSNSSDPQAVEEKFGDIVRYSRYVFLKKQLSHAASSSWLWGGSRNEHFYAARSWDVPIYGFWGTGVFHEYTDPDDGFKIYVYRDRHYHPLKRDRYKTGKEVDPFFALYHCHGMGLRVCGESLDKAN